MFERDKHFSHLSELERELSFRTEMGLYYSYFKTIIEAPTFMDGLYRVRYDNITEFPDTINVLKRFNLYPEVALGIAFRWYESINKALDRRTKICWTVNRGEGKSPVPSCEGLGEPAYFCKKFVFLSVGPSVRYFKQCINFTGLGEPAYFYTESVFALNGIMMGVFFLFGTYLSGSIYGGILTVAGFMYNHGECTRVQWTPPLRESFAYPFFVIEMFLVTHVIRLSRPTYIHSVFIAVAVISFMLPWQFAQFALMTQAVAVFGTYALGYIGSHKVKVIGTGLLSGLLVSYVLLFGNEMLLTSFFASCIVTVMAVQGVMLIVGTLGIKIALANVLRVADDEHIGDIFRSKFSDYKNFHTMLYTCAAEFDFMETETPWKVLKTLLLPSVLISLGALGIKHIYHVFQLLAFTAMAVIIMRLKLFWTPHMALVSSLLASRQLFGWIGSREKHWAAVTVILAGMTYQGIQNLQHQWGIMGEFSNYPLEDLVEWIKETTPKNAVFAGPNAYHGHRKAVYKSSNSKPSPL
ncbi:hypothetical protein FSP39_006326 [Pinctada imbricata]|uniref:C-mannosyltransferase DPY19L1 n=1 Tax=Pinctada imbricata TaxID=66713 RepID=A0AA88YLW5_PINIB|nr:hypothetical protein FSP39_006326 [Pinctada imbricata]